MLLNRLLQLVLQLLCDLRRNPHRVWLRHLLLMLRERMEVDSRRQLQESPHPVNRHKQLPRVPQLLLLQRQ